MYWTCERTTTSIIGIEDPQENVVSTVILNIGADEMMSNVFISEQLLNLWSRE